MAEYLLDRDPVNRAWNTFELDGDKVVIRRYWQSEDVQAVLDANARQRADAPARGDLRQVARVPDIVHYEWLQRFGVRAWDKDHQKEVQRLLNSREFYRLRTNEGTL